MKGRDGRAAERGNFRGERGGIRRLLAHTASRQLEQNDVTIDTLLHRNI